MSGKLESIELRSEEVQDILSDVPNWMIRKGNSLFLVLIVAILIISWLIKYPDTLESQTVITTEVPPQKEYALISGKFDSIYVKNSQSVTKNTVLAVLENTADHLDVFYLQSILDTIRLEQDSFEFPMDSLPLLFLGEIDQSFAEFEDNYFNYTLNKQLRPFSNEAMANSNSLSELYRRLEGLRSQYALRSTELAYNENDLNRHKVLFEKGVISQQEYEGRQLKYLAAERDYKNLGISISQVREAIGEARKNQRGTEISKTREELLLLKKVIQSFNQLKKVIKDWEHRYVLKSDIDGKVSFMNYWNENQTVAQGDLVFTIIPSSNSQYIAKIKAPAHNSGKIRIGQNVNIKLEKYPETEFGMLKGRVHKISLTADEDGFYLVDVSLPKELITSYNKEVKFSQEMMGMAEIITEDLRLLERFFYQFKTLLDR